MPVMNGIEATEIIRDWEMHSGQRCPIIGCTMFPFSHERMLQAGVVRTMVSPSLHIAYRILLIFQDDVLQSKSIFPRTRLS